MSQMSFQRICFEPSGLRPQRHHPSPPLIRSTPPRPGGPRGDLLRRLILHPGRTPVVGMSGSLETRDDVRRAGAKVRPRAGRTGQAPPAKIAGGVLSKGNRFSIQDCVG